MIPALPPYPATRGDRSRWIRGRRTGRNAVDPHVPYAFLHESEPRLGGGATSVNTLFLTNRECPWTCLMCDLWRNTLEESVPPGAIAVQIAHALSRLPPAEQVKLYNAGSFFDPRAIPPGDHAEIAASCAVFQRVIVECHPSLVGGPVLAFRDRLAGTLEVAVGLETSHPETLERLNKGVTVDGFRRASEFLLAAGVPMRVFVLVNPPFLAPAQGVEWANRSTDAAFDAGAETVVLIPTRSGNGAMEALAAAGHFTPPTLAAMEETLAHGLASRRGRVLVDLWDIDRLSHGEPDFAHRLSRIERMAARQRADG